MSAARHETVSGQSRAEARQTLTPTSLSQRGARSRLGQARGQPASEFDRYWVVWCSPLGSLFPHAAKIPSLKGG
eukprot:2247242-Pleurochrysis_carterae.AAC.1